MRDQNPRYSLDSTRIYTVFKLIADGKASTNREISETLDLSQGTVGDALNSLEIHGAVEKGEKGRSQPYKIDRKGLFSVFCELWNLEENEMDEDFQNFLLRYIELYDRNNSRISKMLKEDFAEAAISYKREHETWPECLNFLEDINGLQQYLPVQDYFEQAAEDIFQESLR